MGNLQRRRNQHNLARKHAQPFNARSFFAFFKQYLHSETDAQKGFVSSNIFFDDRDYAGFFQVRHAVTKRTYTRQNQLFRCRNDFFITGNNRITSYQRNCLIDTVQVPQTIINNYDIPITHRYYLQNVFRNILLLQRMHSHFCYKQIEETSFPERTPFLFINTLTAFIARPYCS